MPELHSIMIKYTSGRAVACINTPLHSRHRQRFRQPKHLEPQVSIPHDLALYSRSHHEHQLPILHIQRLHGVHRRRQPRRGRLRAHAHRPPGRHAPDHRAQLQPAHDGLRLAHRACARLRGPRHARARRALVRRQDGGRALRARHARRRRRALRGRGARAARRAHAALRRAWRGHPCRAQGRRGPHRDRARRRGARAAERGGRGCAARGAGACVWGGGGAQRRGCAAGRGDGAPEEVCARGAGRAGSEQGEGEATRPGRVAIPRPRPHDALPYAGRRVPLAHVRRGRRLRLRGPRLRIRTHVARAVLEGEERHHWHGHGEAGQLAWRGLVGLR